MHVQKITREIKVTNKQLKAERYLTSIDTTQDLFIVIIVRLICTVKDYYALQKLKFVT